MNVLALEFCTTMARLLEGDTQATDARFNGMAQGSIPGTVRPTVKGVPAGAAVNCSYPESWMPDRPQLIDLLARTIEMRSRRFNPKTRTIALPPPDWCERLRAKYPYNLACEISSQGGWYDLIEAYIAMRIETGDPPILEQIKQKLGELRLYERGAFRELEWIAMTLSAHVCELCGAPGEVRNFRGWLTTRCDDHAEKTP